MTKHSGSASFLGYEVRWQLSSDTLRAPVLNGIREEVEWFFTGYRLPSAPATALLRVNDFVELGHAVQCFELAKDAEESSPSTVHRYLDGMRSSLELLEKADPRYTYSHSLSRAAAAYAGDMDVESAIDVWNEIRYVLPAPLTGPQEHGPYIVVDDLQSNDSFAETLQPSRGDLRITAVADLDEEEFNEPRRLVFTQGDFDPPPFLTMDRLLKGGELSMTVSIDTEDPRAHLALRDLRRRLDDHFAHSQEIELPLVEYYSSLARAHFSCASLRYNQKARTDLRFRLILLEELNRYLRTAQRRNPELNYACMLAGIAKRACERLDLEASLSLADPIDRWMPEDLRERIPTNWDFERNSNVTDELVWAMLGEADMLVRVIPAPGSQPDAVDWVENYPADIEPVECYLFAELEEDNPA